MTGLITLVYRLCVLALLYQIALAVTNPGVSQINHGIHVTFAVGVLFAWFAMERQQP